MMFNNPISRVNTTERIPSQQGSEIKLTAGNIETFVKGIIHGKIQNDYKRALELGFLGTYDDWIKKISFSKEQEIKQGLTEDQQKIQDLINIKAITFNW